PCFNLGEIELSTTRAATAPGKRPPRRLEPAMDFHETGRVRLTPLPVWQLEQDILEAVRNCGRLVLVAPTGSGKTTQVPQMLLDSGLAGQKRIVVLQPRRVAARTVAARVAWERGTPLGQEVGYQVRFDDQ